MRIIKKELLDIKVEIVNTEKKRKNHYMHLEQAQYKGEKLTIVDIYYSTNAVPSYRVFFFPERYLTYDFVYKKFDETTLDHKLSWWEVKNKIHYVSDTDKKIAIQTLAGEEPKRWWGQRTDESLPFRRQTKINEDVICKRDKKITDPWDEAMSYVQELPKDFEKWVIEEALSNERVIWYLNSGAVAQCTCAHCGEKFVSERMKYRQETVCPHCGLKATALSEKRIEVETGYITVGLLQNYRDGYVLREFNTWYKSTKYEKQEEIGTYEKDRIIYKIEDGRWKQYKTYEYGCFKQREQRWMETEYSSYNTCVLYDKNLKELFESTEFKYCKLWKWAAVKGERISVDSFLYDYPDHPEYEFLIEMGMFNLLADSIGHYSCARLEDGERIWDNLGISKNDFMLAKEVNASIKGIVYIQKCREKKQTPRIEHMKFIEGLSNYSIDKLYGVLEFSTMHKAIKYLTKGQFKPANKLELWKDYIDLGVKMAYNLKDEFVLFPKNIRQAHDGAVELYNMNKANLERKKQNKEYGKISKMSESVQSEYGFETDKYILIAPKDAADIVREGQELHHCVGNGAYTRSMAKNETYILFLRKKEKKEEAYYTVEVSPGGKVKQWYGKYDEKPNKDEISKVIRKYEAEMRRRKKNVKKHLTRSA